jgi:hypothetical protein
MWRFFAWLLLLPSLAFGQLDTLWTQAVGDDWADLWARSIEETPAGDFLVAGQESGESGEQIRAASVSGTGELNWMQRYNVPQWPGDLPPYSFACMALPHANGTFTLIASYIQRTPGAEWWQTTYHPYGFLIQCAANGEPLHADTIPCLNSAIFWCADRTPDGGAIVAGQTEAVIGNNCFDEILLLKLSAEGTVEWWNSFPFAEECIPTKVHQISDGGYLIAGCNGYCRDYDVYNTGNTVYLLRTDSHGQLLWDQTRTGQLGLGDPGMVEMANGQICLAYSLQMMGQDMYSRVYTFSATGDSLGTVVFSSGREDASYVRELRRLDDNTLLLFSTVMVEPHHGVMRVLHLSETLAVLDTVVIDRGGYDIVFNMSRTADGGFAAAGYTKPDSTAPYYQAYVARLETAQSSAPASRPQPASAALLTNYPNPFNPATTLDYTIPAAGPVRLTIADITGRQVAVLEDRTIPAGQFRQRFDGSRLPSGIYFARLQAAGFSCTRKLVLMK